LPFSISIREIVSEKNCSLKNFEKECPCFFTKSKNHRFFDFCFDSNHTLYFCFCPFWTFHQRLFFTSNCLTTLLPAIASAFYEFSIKNAGQANAFLPLLIIPQVALTGALVPLIK
jgi:hypothetical protein